MTHVLTQGISLHDNAEGAVVQSVKLTAGVDESIIMGMVGKKSEVVGLGASKKRTDFTVTGHGDFTMEPGLDADHGISSLTGGMAIVKTFDVEETIAAPSKWSYAGTHYPHATIALAA